MKRILFILLCVSIFSIISCEKDFPAEENKTSVFKFTGIVNGSSININAGDDNYYMYSSHSQNPNGLYTFIGDLKKTNTTFNSLKIELLDDTTTSTGSPSFVNSSLIPANYTIQDSTGTNYTKFDVNFIAVQDSTPGLVVQSYNWNLGDGTIINGGPGIIFHTYKHPGIYNACLTINYANGCSSNICNEVPLGNPNATYITNINSVVDTSGNQSFLVSTTGNPVSYFWNFGDGTTSSAVSPIHNYTTPGIYKICLQITDTNTSIINACANIRSANYTIGCITNFAFLVPTSQSNPNKYSTAIITWTDNAGVVYSSKHVTQPSDSYFKILSVEDYNTNEKGETTKKIHAQFKCKLSNGSSSITITDGNAVFAISYK